MNTTPPHPPEGSSPTFSFSVPTPALLESLAGGAHYSGVKIDHDTSKARRNSHGKPSNHLEVEADHKKVIDDLQELYCCRPTLEIFERRWRPDAIFEVRYPFNILQGVLIYCRQDPLIRCKGFDEYAAQVSLSPSLSQ